MAFTADAFIANIESRLGWGGRHVWDFYRLATGTAWCASEISYAFNMIGAKAQWYGGSPVFYVPYAQAWMAKHYKTIYDYRGTGSLKNVKKGDIIIFMWSRGSRDHIGACRVTTGSGSQLSTIEGNTSGHKVANRIREKKYIYGVYRPPWSDGKEEPYKGTFPMLPKRGWFQKGDRGAEVSNLQRLLNWACDLNLIVDAELGPKTVQGIKTFERMYGLAVDGGFGEKCLAKARTIKK